MTDLHKDIQTRSLDSKSLIDLLPQRSRDTHKGDYGHVLVIGGDYGMGGAVRVAAEAAMRVGAGLVSVATRPEHVSVVNCSRPEIMCYEVGDAVSLEPLLKRANMVVIGPGLGKSPWAQTLLAKTLSYSIPKLLDADALNLLAENPQQSSQWILTPHAGEAARLLSTSIPEIQGNRLQAIQKLQIKYEGVIVLKGAGTLVSDHCNTASICPAGNPGMASGGMGDLLSGVIGGLVAQGIPLLAAAEAGVLIHSMAADLAAKEGGERGLLATDLLTHLRRLVNPIVTHTK